MEKCPRFSSSSMPKPEPEPEPKWLLKRTEELWKTDWQRPGSVDIFLQRILVTVQFKEFFLSKISALETGSYIAAQTELKLMAILP